MSTRQQFKSKFVRGYKIIESDYHDLFDSVLFTTDEVSSASTHVHDNLTQLSTIPVTGIPGQVLTVNPAGTGYINTTRTTFNIITGEISGDGTILKGTGFTVVHQGIGQYIINLNVPMVNPVMTANANVSRSNVIVTTGTSNNSSLGAYTTLDGAWYDCKFQFIIVG